MERYGQTLFSCQLPTVDNDDGWVVACIKKYKNPSNHPDIFSELSLYVIYKNPKYVEIFKIGPFFCHGHPLL